MLVCYSVYDGNVMIHIFHDIFPSAFVPWVLFRFLIKNLKNLNIIIVFFFRISESATYT